MCIQFIIYKCPVEDLQRFLLIPNIGLPNFTLFPLLFPNVNSNK